MVKCCEPGGVGEAECCIIDPITDQCLVTDSIGCAQAGGVLEGVNECVECVGCEGGVTMINCGDQVTVDNTTNDTIPNPMMSCDSGGITVGSEWFSFVATADSVNINTCNSIAALGDDSTVVDAVAHRAGDRIG